LNCLDTFESCDFVVTQNWNDYKLILWRASTGEIVWKSDKLETYSFSLKIVEKERKILVALKNGKGTVVKY
jgi:hypothetical protein